VNLTYVNLECIILTPSNILFKICHCTHVYLSK